MERKTPDILLWSWLVLIYCCLITAKIMNSAYQDPLFLQSVVAHLQIFPKDVFIILSQTFKTFFGRTNFLTHGWLIQSRLMPVTDVFCKSLSYSLPLSFSLSFLKDKFWYCRLSPNHKVLHYGDLEESPQGEVPHESLQDKCEWNADGLQKQFQHSVCSNMCFLHRLISVLPTVHAQWQIWGAF